MKFKSFFILLAAVLILSACESSVINPPLTIDNSTTLAYSGGLNVKFDKGIQEFNKSVRIINQENDSYLLDLQMNVKTLDDPIREQATLQFDIPFTSEDGNFPVGNYNLTQEQIKSAYSSYELNKVNGDFARYNFEGASATLKIDASNSEKIIGNFIINLEQISGKRMTDGQVEDVILNSPIKLQSHFNLEF
jgi:hypothetical protein